MSSPDPSTPSRFVWETRYRDPEARPAESDITDTWRRVAAAAASQEDDPPARQQKFLDILSGFRFLPAGRILAGAGSARHVTLFSCFVMGTIEDSIEGIFDALKEGALTMQRGGGIGYDFSTLRPRGGKARATGMTASGPVSFLGLWDAMCTTMLSTGVRRGAMMATLRCDHPDVAEFIDAKREPGALRNFNLSVLRERRVHAARSRRMGRGGSPSRPRRRRLSSRKSFRAGTVGAACARAPMPRPNRACCSSIASMPGTTSAIARRSARPIPAVKNRCPRMAPATSGRSISRLSSAMPSKPEPPSITRRSRRPCGRPCGFLDNVIDISRFPLPQQRTQAHRARRIGLGMTGLADALAMLGLRYDSEAARRAAASAMQTIRDAAYRASVELATERGSFPAFVADAYLRTAVHPGAAGRYPRRNPRSRHPQQSPDRAGARRQHQPAGRQRQQRHRAHIPAGGHATGHRRRRRSDGSLAAMDHAWARVARAARQGARPAIVSSPPGMCRQTINWRCRRRCSLFVDSAISQDGGLAGRFSRIRCAGLFRTRLRPGAQGMHHPPRRRRARAWSQNDLRNR